MKGDQVTIEPKICDYCGGYITEVNQKCPALDDGYCQEEADLSDWELIFRDG